MNLSFLSGKRGIKKGIFQELVRKSQGQIPDLKDYQTLKAKTHFGVATLYGAASFYDETSAKEANVKARVCSGTCCMIAGTQEMVKVELLNKYKPNEISEVRCLGRCYENSAYQIQNQNFSGNHSSSQIPAYSISQHKILTGAPLKLEGFSRAWSQAKSIPREQLVSEVKEASLRGRGGAGFPLARKLESCLKEDSEQKFLVCNADEGDPGAFSDRYLMEVQPFTVLLGMAIAARAIGAETAIIYIRAEYPESMTLIENAISEIEKISGCPEVELIAVRGAGAYVCGEETALLSSLEGQRPEVRVRPPYPVQQGLFLKPTVVSNVETLACLPWIIEHSGKSFHQIGTALTSGTKLVCLDSGFKKPGVYEVDMGFSLEKLLLEVAGGFRQATKALQVGGPLGGIVPKAKIADLNLDFESFQRHGFLLGHASVVAIPESFPMIQFLQHLFEFTALESCGKCFPCRIGSQRGVELIEEALSKKSKINSELFSDLLETLEVGSLCALGGGLPLPIQNAMKYFEAELAPYFEGSYQARSANELGGGKS